MGCSFFFFASPKGFVGRRIEVPTRESIYRALVTNHRILDAQKLAAHKLEKQIKEVRIRSLTTQGGGGLSSPTLRSSAVGGDSRIASDLARLTDSFLEKTKLGGDGREEEVPPPAQRGDRRDRNPHKQTTKSHNKVRRNAVIRSRGERWNLTKMSC